MFVCGSVGTYDLQYPCVEVREQPWVLALSFHTLFDSPVFTMAYLRLATVDSPVSSCFRSAGVTDAHVCIQLHLGSGPYAYMANALPIKSPPQPLVVFFFRDIGLLSRPGYPSTCDPTTSVF